jgi:hypothetical protein
MNYQHYISSREGPANSVRLAELESAGFRCPICNSGGEGVTIEAHHHTYEKLGHKQPGDLTALGRTCRHVVPDQLRHVRYEQHPDP